MKTTSHFDDDIRDAVTFDKNTANLASAGDEGLFEQLAATFRTRMRFWIVLMWSVNLLLTGVFAWSAWRFFHADEVRDYVLFAAICTMAAIMIGHVKLWFYMEMNKNTHTRELKRLELQIAQMRRESLD